MQLSDLVRGGQTLAGRSGSAAINSGDLLLQTGYPLQQLFSAKVSDYAASANVATGAGTSIVANTVTSLSSSAQSSTRRTVLQLADGSIMLCGGGNAGAITAAKYSANGVLLYSVVLHAVSSLTVTPVIIQLSNGNIAFIYGPSAGTATYFTITDSTLAVVVAETTIRAVAAAQAFDAVALSGGGFAVISQSGTTEGGRLAIYTNAGAVTLASTAISGFPTGGNVGLRIAQLSSGDIVVASCGPASTSGTLFATFTAAGVAAVAATTLDGTAPVNLQIPDIAVMTGFFCLAVSDQTNLKAYVVSNAGVTQGAPFSVGNANTASECYRVLTDNVRFWLIGYGNSNYFIAGLPTSGTGYVTNNTGLNPSSAGTTNKIDAFYDNGYIVIAAGGSAVISYVYWANPTSMICSLQTSYAFPTALGTASIHIMPGGDFAELMWEVDSGNLAVQKYANAAIVGVSNATVAAGAAGTRVTFNQGGGSTNGRTGYPTNPLGGTVGKSFDHSAANVIGNKGTLYSDSVALEGIV